MKEYISIVRPFWPAVKRGATLRCPACGKGALFRKYLKVADECAHCGEALHHQEADDGPAYATIFVVGHVLVPLVLIVERTWQPEFWVHAVLWGPFAVAMSLTLLPITKGALVAAQWSKRMHGFGL
jgi:uncharacterized protein (DUF983 family)